MLLREIHSLLLLNEMFCISPGLVCFIAAYQTFIDMKI